MNAIQREANAHRTRVLHYRAFGYWPGEAPREPDDLRDCLRDAANDLTDVEWEILKVAYDVPLSRIRQQKRVGPVWKDGQWT